MATTSGTMGTKTLFNGSPKLTVSGKYTITRASKTTKRITVDVDLTFRVGVDSTSWLGSGYKITAYGNTNGVNDPFGWTDKSIKETTTTWRYGNPKTVSWTRSFDSLSSNTIAFKMYTDGSGAASGSGNYGCGSKSSPFVWYLQLPDYQAPAPTPTVTACSPPTTVSTTSSAKPGELISISWSGASAGTGNSIAGYRLYYKQGYSSTDTPTTSDAYVTINTSSTSGSTYFTIPTSAVPSLYYTFKVQTIGTSLATSGGISSASDWVLVARAADPPPAPDVYFNGSASIPANGGGAVSFWAYTSRGAEIKYFYRIGYGGQVEMPYASDVNIYLSAATTLYFWTMDPATGETSSEVSRYIAATADPPEITAFKIEAKTLQGKNGTSGINLVRAGSCSFDSNMSVSNTWYFRQSSSSNPSGASRVSFSTNTKLVDYDFSSLNIPKGNYYQIGLVISGNGLTTERWSSTFQMPLSPTSATITKVTNKEDGTFVEGASNSQFNETLSIAWANPPISNGGLYLKSVRPIYRTKTAGTNWSEVTTTSIEGLLEELATNLKGFKVTIPKGSNIQLGIRVTDNSGAYVDKFFTDSSGSDLFLTRSKGPQMPEKAFFITGPQENNILTIRPYTNKESVKFTFPTGNSENGIKYIIRAFVEDKNQRITLFNSHITGEEPNIEFSGDKATIYLTYTSEEINNKLKVPELKDNPSDLYWKSNYLSVKYEFLATDAFGTESELTTSQNTHLKFSELPFFKGTDKVSLGINYLPNHTSPIGNSIKFLEIFEEDTTEPTFKKINNERMINPGESVVLSFPLAEDYNNDIVGYQLYVSRLDDKPNLSYDMTYLEENNQYVLLKTFTPEELKQNTIIPQEVYVQYYISEYF